MDVIFWCEFPEQVNWERLAKWLEQDDRSIVTYVTCSSLRDFELKKKAIHKHSSRVHVYAWPTLSHDEGYWFSGYTQKKSIEKLEEFRDVDIKIDIEPPIPKGSYSLLMASAWFFRGMFRSAKNSKLLQDTIKEMSQKKKIIVSTFPVPTWVSTRWGWVASKSCSYNYMYYSTFIPYGFLWLYNVYYRWFMRSRLDSYFAIGLVGVGIFGNEPIYSSLNEMIRDIAFLKKHGAKKFVVYRLGAVVDRGKDWFDVAVKI